MHNILILILILTLFFLTFPFIAPLQSATAATFRKDLIASAEAFCGNASALTIHDAQIEVAIVKDVKNLANFAAEFAGENRHRGYSYGTCRDKRDWIVSTPAPAAIMQLEKNTLIINTPAMSSTCETYDIDGIQVQRDLPEILAQARKPGKKVLRIELGKAKYSSLALTCHPSDRNLEGPELWSLISLEQEKEKEPSIIPQMFSSEDLLNWISEKRATNGLPALQLDKDWLQTVVDEASMQRDLRHPRELLMKAKKKLKESGVDLLGENRASAADLKAMASLLWNSPQHRRLLLHPKANRIAYHISQRDDQKLLILLLAHQGSPPASYMAQPLVPVK